MAVRGEVLFDELLEQQHVAHARAVRLVVGLPKNVSELKLTVSGSAGIGQKYVLTLKIPKGVVV